MKSIRRARCRPLRSAKSTPLPSFTVRSENRNLRKSISVVSRLRMRSSENDCQCTMGNRGLAVSWMMDSSSSLQQSLMIELGKLAYGRP